MLNAWSIFQGDTNNFWLSWALPQFLNAAEILRKNISKSQWKQADLNAFNTMVKNYFLPNSSKKRKLPM
jgi:hypothetical protein